MAIQQDIEGLLKINEDIRKQRRILIARRILLVFLIGFLIGRDIHKKLSDNAQKKKEILQHVEDYFKNLNLLLNRLEELRKIEAFTARVEEKKCVERLLSLRADFRFLVTVESEKIPFG